MNLKNATKSAWRIFIVLGASLVVVFIVLSMAFAFVLNSVKDGFTGSASLPADCALVFGSAVHGQNTPGPGIMRRVGTAVVLYRDKRVNRMIMTGGKGSDWQTSEAAVMKQYALDLGVPEEDIVIEEHATSTWENLQNTLYLTKKCKDILAISDRYHLSRIEYLAKKQGREGITTFPAMWIPTQMFEKRMIIREAFALIYYSLIL